MTNLGLTATSPAAPSGDAELEQFRVELRAHCYRMLGSAFEADDAAQETLVRAWRNLDRFEGRASLRSWLYRIATNVCIDMLRGRQRRAMPMDFVEPSSGDVPPAPPRSEAMWLQPIPGALAVPVADDPAELAAARDGVRLAFVAALQHLPPRQRAVLILREVLRWRAAEVAELLDTSVVSVNSALQRARATLAASDLTESTVDESMDEEGRALLARYVDAFERFDVEKLVALLHEDATVSMPPYAMWMRGPKALGRWLHGPGAGCEGSRLAPVDVNGVPGFAQWRRSGPTGGYTAWAIHSLEVRDGRISGLHFFVDADLFPLFGLPRTLDDTPA